MSEDKIIPDDKFGKKIVIGTGGFGLHEARNLFYDDTYRDKAQPYGMVMKPQMYPPMTPFEMGVEIKDLMALPPKIDGQLRDTDWQLMVDAELDGFYGFDGPDWQLWEKKHTLAKNRLKKWRPKSFYKRCKLI